MSTNKRQRKINSCQTCRKRRVKCDKLQPNCSRCAASRIECSYETSPEKAARVARPATSESSSHDQLGHGEKFQALSGPTEIEINDSSPRTSVANGQDGYLSVGQHGRSRFYGPNFWASSGGYRDPIYISRLSLSPAAQDVDLQNYNQAEGMPPSISQQRLLNGFSPLDFNDPKIGNSVVRQWIQLKSGNLQKCRFCGRRYTLPCVLSTLPPRKACDVLFLSFFTTVYPLIPILHLPTLSGEYESFWSRNENRDWHTSLPDRILSENPSFVSLLFSALFAGSMTMPTSRLAELSSLGHSVLPGDLYFGTMISMALTGFPRRPTLDSLAAYLFTQNQLTREEEFLDSPSFISTAFRIALGMGLHRDSSTFGFSEPESDMRRGMWWHIIHTDVMASSSSGLPPLFIDEGMANTTMISKFEGSTQPGGDHPRLERKVDMRHLVAIARYSITKELRHIIGRQIEDRLLTAPQLEEALAGLETLRHQVWNTIDSLNSSGRIQTWDQSETLSVAETINQPWALDSCADEVEAFRSWSTQLLHLMLHKAYCVLFNPLMRRTDQRLWLRSRKTAIKHNHAFLQIFAQICSDPRFEHFQWMYPGTYQPLQALSLLLADLLRSPLSDEATTSRALVDAAFALYETDEGIVSYEDAQGNYAFRRRNLSSSGKEAWAMLTIARQRALEQLGQDPHMLWPIDSGFPDGHCVCGGQIALQDAATSTNLDLRQIPVPGLLDATSFASQSQDMASVVPEGFDWDEWDSILGSGPGVFI